MLRTTIFVLTTFIVLNIFWGCSPKEKVVNPYPVSSELSSAGDVNLDAQKKMQSMQHWSVLAEEVASRIERLLENRVVERRFPIYVAPSGLTSFEKNFYELLLTKLVKKNLPVTGQTQDAMVLSFEIGVVRHASSALEADNSVLSSLAPGVYVKKTEQADKNKSQKDLNDKFRVPAVVINSERYKQSFPRTEIMITSSLRLKEQYIMRDSSIYYINEKEVALYEQRTIHQPSNLKNYQIVDN